MPESIQEGIKGDAAEAAVDAIVFRLVKLEGVLHGTLSKRSGRYY